eukprot:m.252714 g.252714  ORF g.252714 m.252714 type:complete len:245 (+) comp54528_c0_seq4:1-735(+)
MVLRILDLLPRAHTNNMADRSSISKILKTIDRFDPAQLPLFIKYLKDAIEAGSYDLEAFLAILKIYQFNPRLFDVETTRTILLQAMTSLPNNDFTLCLGLLTEAQLSHADIAPIIELNGYLETCMFTNFWGALAESPAYLVAKVKVADGYLQVDLSKFKHKIREYITLIINSTYQRIEKPVCNALLGHLSDAEFTALAAQKEWKIEGEMVTVARQEEHIKSKNIVESIAFESSSLPCFRGFHDA